jgi:hypothetical protein
LSALLAAGAAAVLAGHAAAASVDKVSKELRSAVLQGIVDCRAMTDADARLKCYDAAAARLDAAEASGQVVVVDREQLRQARKEAFGLTLPSLDALARGSGKLAKAAMGEDADRITASVKQVSRRDDGRWVIVLETGAVWRQVDDESVEHPPHPQSTAEIRKAALGSYFMKLDGQRSIRVMRDR